MYCIYCGQKNDENYNYCVSCGKMNPEKTVADNINEKPNMDDKNTEEILVQSTKNKSQDGKTQEIATIFLEIMGWLFSIVGAFIISGDAYLAIGFIAGYILYKNSGEKRFKIMMIIAAILLIIISVISFIGNALGLPNYGY